eukprot:gene11645-13060_t
MNGNQVNAFDFDLAVEEIDELLQCFDDYQESLVAITSINDSDKTSSASVREVPTESSVMRPNAGITPYEIDFILDITYWLDNDHRIYRMDIKSVAFEEFEADRLFR